MSLHKHSKANMSVGTGSVLGGKWKLGKLLGEGSCGKVYQALSVDNKEHLDYDLVIKVIPTGESKKGKAAKDQDRVANTLNYEYILHTGILMGFPYAPRLPSKFYGHDNGVRYLVMERLEMDLEGFANQSPTIKEIADVGIQLLKGLEWLHKKGYLFVDIKPQNFMIKGSSVYFVDYGLVERWVAFDSSGARIAEARQVVGTPAYLSVNVHRGNTPSRNDEIESLGLVLLSLAQNGKLPWSNCSSDIECKTMKENCNIIEFADDLGCSEIGEIITLARSGSYSSSPDYTAIEALLTSMRSTQKQTSLMKKEVSKVSKSVKSRLKTSSVSNSTEQKEKKIKADDKVEALPVKKSAAKKPVKVIAAEENFQATSNSSPIIEKRNESSTVSVTTVKHIDHDTKSPVRKSLRLSLDRKSFDPDELPFSASFQRSKRRPSR